MDVELCQTRIMGCLSLDTQRAACRWTPSRVNSVEPLHRRMKLFPTKIPFFLSNPSFFFSHYFRLSAALKGSLADDLQKVHCTDTVLTDGICTIVAGCKIKLLARR